MKKAEEYCEFAGPLEKLYEDLSPYFLMDMNGYAERRKAHLHKI